MEEIKEPIDIITLQETPEEQSLDFSPKSFDDYLGQTELKKSLPSIRKQQRCVMNRSIICFFSGLPGLGKTTLAHNNGAHHGCRHQNLQRPYDGTDRRFGCYTFKP